MLGTGRSRSGEQADGDNGAENGDPAAGEGAGDSDGLEDQEGFAPPLASWADLSERRQLRHKYRTLINETREDRLDLIKPESKGLNDRLIKGDELFQNVKMPREAVLDSQFLVLASTLGSQKANQLHTDFVTFEPHVFTFAKKVMFSEAFVYVCVCVCVCVSVNTITLEGLGGLS
ncbi:non-structural maintenance of chromosomes element 4 homolog A-like [Branchiostoma floridae x Branchiostoma belcheri]